MPSKWIGWIHRGQVGKRWSPRENAYRYNPEDKSCNAGRPEYEMQLHTEFLTEPTKEEMAIFCPASETTLDEHEGKIIRNHCVNG